MSVRLFQNSVLERLTFMPIRWFIPVWIAVVAAAGWRCAGLNVGHVMALFAGGLLFWTLVEYSAHRHLFHLQPTSEPVQKFIYLIHGNHHADPADPMRNMMPLVVTLPLAVLFWFVFVAIFGAPGNAIFMGFASGYALYDVAHYAAHQWRPSLRILEILRLHHLRHHYKTPDSNFAITAVFWDRVFGTQAPRRRR